MFKEISKQVSNLLSVTTNMAQRSMRLKENAAWGVTTYQGNIHSTFSHNTIGGEEADKRRRRRRSSFSIDPAAMSTASHRARAQMKIMGVESMVDPSEDTGESASEQASRGLARAHEQLVHDLQHCSM